MSNMSNSTSTVPVCGPARPNKYGGDCGTCGGGVRSREGTIAKVGGRWVVYHLKCAGQAAPAKARHVACDNAPMCGCCY